MRASTMILSFCLVASNAWWLYRAVDRGITNTYAEQQRYEDTQRIAALSRLGTLALRGQTRAQAITMLRSLAPESDPYEKDGALHAHWISMPMDAQGRVVEVKAD